MSYQFPSQAAERGYSSLFGRPISSVLSSFRYRTTKRRGLLILPSLLVLLIIAYGTFYHPFEYPILPILPARSCNFDTPNLFPASQRPKEAYVLYNPTSQFPDYMDNAHLLTIFGLKQDSELRDPYNRDVVVMVTNETSSNDIQKLKEAGAKIFQVPTSLRSVLPTRDHWPERYFHMWDKLWVFTLTEYERVVYLDSDMAMNRPIHSIWESHNSDFGFLAATADIQPGMDHVTPLPDGPYFNAGLMMIKPNQTVFEEILKVEILDEEPLLWAEQDLLNKYYSRDGPRPWVPLDHMYHTILPSDDDARAGVNLLHYKLWEGGPSESKLVYTDRRARMFGWRMAMDRMREVNGCMSAQ